MAPSAECSTHLDKQILAAQEARTIATAVMSYSIDNNAFPVLTNGVTTMQSLESVLEPVHVLALPLSDPWNHPDAPLVQRNFVPRLQRGFRRRGPVVRRVLADAEDPDAAIRSLCRGAVDEFGADLIFANGEPCQWASGSLKE